MYSECTIQGETSVIVTCYCCCARYIVIGFRLNFSRLEHIHECQCYFLVLVHVSRMLDLYRTGICLSDLQFSKFLVFIQCSIRCMQKQRNARIYFLSRTLLFYLPSTLYHFTRRLVTENLLSVSVLYAPNFFCSSLIL